MRLQISALYLLALWLAFMCSVIREIVKQLRKPRGKGAPRVTARDKYRFTADETRDLGPRRPGNCLDLH